MLEITLFIFSVTLNIALKFGIVRKNTDEDMVTIRTRERLDTHVPEYYSALQSKSVSG